MVRWCCLDVLLIWIIVAQIYTWRQLVLLTTILNHKTCINTSRQVLEKTLFAINAIFTALIANSVFFKTLAKSMYTSNMIKGGGQGGLKRKITDPKYL